MSYSFNWDVENHMTYHVLKPLAYVVLNTMYNIECKGRENVPREGSFILACNHVMALDPVFLAYCSGRTCHFMAKSEFFQSRVKGVFLSSVNAFPVKRGKANSQAFDYAVRILGGGDVLGIFPEGARSKDGTPKSAKSGAAHLACVTNTPVLPACLYRDLSEKLRPYVAVRFGKIIDSSALGITGEKKPSQLHAASRLIMDAITDMWNEEKEAHNG